MYKKGLLSSPTCCIGSRPCLPLICHFKQCWKTLNKVWWTLFTYGRHWLHSYTHRGYMNMNGSYFELHFETFAIWTLHWNFRIGTFTLKLLPWNVQIVAFNKGPLYIETYWNLHTETFTLKSSATDFQTLQLAGVNRRPCQHTGSSRPECSDWRIWSLIIWAS